MKYTMIVLAVLLAGCAPEQGTPEFDDRIEYRTKDSLAGTVLINVEGVDCMVYRSQDVGGITCDWEGRR